MIIKNIFFAILFFFTFSSNQSIAQWSFGIDGGLNIGKSTPSNLHTGSELFYKNGVVFGGVINYKINNYFNIHSGLRYDQKGGKMTHNNPGFVGNATVYYNYLEVPLQILYIPFDIELKPTLIVGVNISYILLAKGEGTINNQTRIEDDTKNIDNRFDVFLETGVGIMPKINDDLFYSFTASYYYGVSDLDEYIATSGFHLLLGIYYNL